MKVQFQDQEFGKEGGLWPFLKQIFGYSYRYKKMFWAFVLGVAVVALCDAVFPLIWLNFLDEVITPMVGEYKASLESDGGSVPGMDGLYQFGIIYLIWTAIQIASLGIFIYYTGKLRETVVYDLRKEMFERLQTLSFSFYDRSAIGWLISRITSDTDRVAEVISWGFLSLVWGVVMIFACFAAMFFYHWQLTLVVLVTLPLLVIVSYKLRVLVITFSRKARKINSEMTAVFNEHVHGVDVNKVTAQEDNAAKGFSLMSENMRGASFKASYYSAMYFPAVVMVGSLAAAAVVYLGGHLTLAENGITVGILAAFFGYATWIFEPIMDITRFYAMAQSSMSAGERIFSLIEEESDIKDDMDATDYDDISGEIQFKNLDFHYVAEKPILQNLSFAIQAGESIALVGPTGEGKTTIASLISRFYEPTGGSLLIDGVDYRSRTLSSLRRQLGIILQTPHVFSGTIIENIRYGNQEASEAQITNVLNSIGAGDLLPRLQENIGEEGGTLSIGEKQMISFARVILKDPKILIMDEATASVDTLAEARIQKGIDALIRGRTSIIIAHRLSTIKNCDRIFVINKGKIRETGSHQELINQKGFYYNLYTRQAREAVA